MRRGSKFRQGQRMRSRITEPGNAHRNHVLSELNQPLGRRRCRQQRFAGESGRDRTMLTTFAFVLLSVGVSRALLRRIVNRTTTGFRGVNTGSLQHAAAERLPEKGRSDQQD